MTNAKTIRWGILGCGDVTEVKSGPALQQANGSELVAVMRRSPGLAQDYAARHGVPFYTEDAAELIGHPKVDIVYVATPPGSHLELALQVCAAGKPCYVEKPVARSAAESRAMLAAFEAAGLPLFVGFYRRGLQRFQTARQILASGQLGTLTGVSYLYTGGRHNPAPAAAPPAVNYVPDGARPAATPVALPWRLEASESGAGLFYDLGSHLLDVLDYVVGPLTDVSGVARNCATPIDVEDGVAMSFLTGGALGVARWNFAASYQVDLLVLEGTAGKLSLSCFGGEDLLLETAAGTQTFPGANPRHVHSGLVQTIVDQLRGQGQALSTGATALRTMEVMDKVLTSYYGGREDDFWTRPETWPKK